MISDNEYFDFYEAFKAFSFYWRQITIIYLKHLNPYIYIHIMIVCINYKKKKKTRKKQENALLSMCLLIVSIEDFKHYIFEV